MIPFYLPPYYPSAKKVAHLVRALPPDAWVKMTFWLWEDRIEPFPPEVVDIDKVPPSDLHVVICAGDWIAEFDREFGGED